MVTGGIIAKCLENLDGKHSETICLELTVSKKKKKKMMHNFCIETTFK